MSKIIGNTTATPVAIPDWKQTDSSKADYIKNKPDFDELSAKVGESSVSDQILLAIDNIDFPVDSVNGKTGAVTLTASDVGATTQDYVDSQIDEVKSYTDTKVAGLVNSAPETLDTLNELADALGDDPNFAATMATELGKKATKVELASHNHDDIYYLQTDIDAMISSINAEVSNSLNEAKLYSDANFNTAQNYTDNAVAQKTQVQMITWGVDD